MKKQVNKFTRRVSKVYGRMLSILSRVTVFILFLCSVHAVPLFAQVSDADAAMMIGQGLGEALGGQSRVPSA